MGVTGWCDPQDSFIYAWGYLLGPGRQIRKTPTQNCLNMNLLSTNVHRNGLLNYCPSFCNITSVQSLLGQSVSLWTVSLGTHILGNVCTSCCCTSLAPATTTAPGNVVPPENSVERASLGMQACRFCYRAGGWKRTTSTGSLVFSRNNTPLLYQSTGPAHIAWDTSAIPGTAQHYNTPQQKCIGIPEIFSFRAMYFRYMWSPQRFRGKSLEHSRAPFTLPKLKEPAQPKPFILALPKQVKKKCTLLHRNLRP